MAKKILICCLILGILSAHQYVRANDNVKDLVKSAEPLASSATTSVGDHTNEASKDKRQIASKDTPIYPNHRTESISDDPELAQETIYGAKPNQFIIRAVSPHHHQQHEEHQELQLQNYPATTTATATATVQRPHNSQLLEQSQEIQHFAYLQDISRNHPKTNAVTAQTKPRTALSKKATIARSQLQYAKPEEAEQRYAVAIQAPGPGPHHFQPSLPYQHQQPQHPQQHQQPQQQYQIIPEEHFLKLIEQELQARAYHDEQVRQQQAHAQSAAIAASNKLSPLSDRSSKGLGNYRQRIIPQPQPPTPTSPAELEPTTTLGSPTPAYVQYVPRHRGGPKYLPLPQGEQQISDPQYAEAQEPQPPEIPPQIAYYQPQVSYKTLPNHPLAQSSLEKEIEKLLATNRPAAAAVQIIDSSNEPSAVNHHYQPQPQPQPQVHAHRSPKAYAIANTTPNSLLDANNQPFIPSLFRFSNFQAPTPIYPTQVPQHVIEAKKLGPVVYPTQTPNAAQPVQQSQYYYQETIPSPKTKVYRPKQYDIKLLQPTPLKPREKGSKFPTAASKYAQPLIYEYSQEAPQLHPQTRAQPAPGQFYPSPPDPNNKPEAAPTLQPTQATTHPEPPPVDFRQFVLPAPAPSQSSIYVSQGTGITTASRPTTAHHKPKTLEDVKQLRLPQPGGKPLTQAEFQALIDAGYPVTAVPVPVPVPYEQYVKDHPEYRNQPIDYAQLMRNAQQQYAARAAAPRLAAASEPSVKIVSSPTEPQTATAIGGGSVTYLRPIQHTEQRRHLRNNDKETEIDSARKKENAEFKA